MPNVSMIKVLPVTIGSSVGRDFPWSEGGAVPERRDLSSGIVPKFNADFRSESSGLAWCQRASTPYAPRSRRAAEKRGPLTLPHRESTVDRSEIFPLMSVQGIQKPNPPFSGLCRLPPAADIASHTVTSGRVESRMGALAWAIGSAPLPNKPRVRISSIGELG